MTLRTVLTMFDGVEADSIDLEASRHLAERFACHTDLLHIRRDALSQLPMIGEGVSADLIDMIQAQANREEQTLTDRRIQVFEKWCRDYNIEMASSPIASHRPSARLLDVTGAIQPNVARFGRLVDLVVLPSPSLQDGSLSSAADAAIYETGRPVLFSPRRSLPSLGKRISVFWNDTVEASRATKAAEPFLEKAEAIQVKAVDDSSVDAQSASELVASLRWRGIAVDLRMVSPDGRQVGEALLDAAWDFEADLIVMGAFSHSRLREFILGGVTQHILDVAGRPVMMMH